MVRTIRRRDAIRGLGVATITALAGCTGGDGDGDGGDGDSGGSSGDESDSGGGSTDDGGSGGDTATSTDDDSDSGSMGTSNSFEYTFGSNDDVSGSSLTALRANYPDGSGAVSDAEIASVMLGGEDVADDLNATSTSNNGTSLSADFGGAYDITAEETLTMELSGVSTPDGTYTVEVVVNPQSGATTFETSF
ncbi:hypothetical protein [Salinirubrum litoreum]|uniref:Uncharacterized protein n=1 Tax=Salinirubrum litoreum TaxID=1126234 RepID=A0ABD5RB95_9EURY|nr:hypothetical protein [Salinirubrum litoreum]